MTKEEIKEIVDAILPILKDEITLAAEVAVENGLKGAKGVDVDALLAKVDSKIMAAKLELKGVAGKPELKADPDFNADGKLFGPLDKVIMKPTPEWLNYGKLNPNVPVHADKEFECIGHQATKLGQRGQATFVKVSKVYVKKDANPQAQRITPNI